MNPANCLFKCGDYWVFRMPECKTFSIYHVIDIQMELMAGGFLNLADAIEFLLHPSS